MLIGMIWSVSMSTLPAHFWELLWVTPQVMTVSIRHSSLRRKTILLSRCKQLQPTGFRAENGFC